MRDGEKSTISCQTGWELVLFFRKADDPLALLLARRDRDLALRAGNGL
jgi:hypothetical protein